jgi:YebC/PmpR family DNA-binding regulatory protein
LAIANAKAESMPRDNIDRAIKKAQGGDVDALEEIRYEGFGPGGAGLIVEVLTDNRNRAAANVRALFSRHGGNMGDTGSVAFMFERQGEIRYPAAAGSEEAILEAAIDAGAEDTEADEDGHAIFTAYEDLAAVAEILEGVLGAPTSAKIVWRPRSDTPLDAAQSATLIKLVSALEDDDDVQSVWTNAEIDEEVLA